MAIKLIFRPHSSLTHDIDFKVGRTRRFYLGYTDFNRTNLMKMSYGYQMSNDFDNCTILMANSSSDILELYREKIEKYIC